MTELCDEQNEQHQALEVKRATGTPLAPRDTGGDYASSIPRLRVDEMEIEQLRSIGEIMRGHIAAGAQMFNRDGRELYDAEIIGDELHVSYIKREKIAVPRHLKPERLVFVGEELLIYFEQPLIKPKE